jgi:hypothetical protein
MQTIPTSNRDGKPFTLRPEKPLLMIHCARHGCLVFGDLRTRMASSRSKRIRRQDARTFGDFGHLP